MADKTEDKIESGLEYELKESRLTSRQLLVQNEVTISSIRKQIRQLRQTRLNKRRSAEIIDLLTEIQILKSKNKILLQNINKDNYRARKEVTDGIKLQKKNLRPSYNLRRFDSKFREYVKNRIWIDIIYVIIGSFLITIAFDYFVNSTGVLGLFPPGLGAIARKLAIVSAGKVAHEQNTFYFLIYIGLNVPFVIFGFLKVGFKFSMLTLLGLIFQNIINLIIVSIPAIDPINLKLLINFESFSETIQKSQTSVYLIWLFLFAIIGAALAGAGYSFLYRCGGSSAGADFASGYIQKKYHVSIATVNVFVNIMITISIFIINSATVSVYQLAAYYNETIKYVKAHEQIVRIQYFFGPTFFASFVLLVVQALVCNLIYPRYKYLEFKVFTAKGRNLIDALNFKGFDTNISMKSTDVFTQNQHFQSDEVTLYCSMVELKNLKTILKVVDPDANYAANYVKTAQYRLLNTKKP